MTYLQAQNACEKTLKSNKIRQQLLGWIRAGLFLGMIGAIVLATSYSLMYWVLFFGLTGLFLRIVVLHQRKRDYAVFLQHKLAILNYELNSGDHPFSKPNAAALQSSVAIDLDLFSTQGIFEKLNRTVSPQGADFLAYQLQHPTTDEEAIQSFQEITKEWSEKLPLVHNLMAEGLAASQQYGSAPDLSPAHFARYSWLPWLLSAFGIVALAGQFFGLHYYWLIAAFFGNLLIISRFKKLTSQIGSQLSGQEATFGAYAKVFSHLKGHSFQQPQLRDMQEVAKVATLGLGKLAKITNSFEQLHNLFVQSFLNGILGYELHILANYDKWHQQFAGQLSDWIAQIQILDYWNSLAIWKYNHPTFEFPDVAETHFGITATALGHPLLSDDQRVSNPVQFLVDHNRVSLVTGSNMSGKSTYLRSIGVNLLLGRLGTVVCGQNVKMAPLRLLTFIRVTDSIADGASFFYAELQRLKYIRETISDQQPSIVLLDEILRGTNSEDKYLGSKRFAEALLQYNAITIMATHDLKLSELENDYPEKVKNLAFESEITDGNLVFDYKLRYGVARNKNATYLMEKMGVIDSSR